MFYIFKKMFLMCLKIELKLQQFFLFNIQALNIFAQQNTFRREWDQRFDDNEKT